MRDKRSRRNKSAFLIGIYTVFILFSLLNTTIQAQIHIQIEGAPKRTFYLQQIKGDRIYKVDSAQIEENKLVFNWKPDYQAGMYRLFNGETDLVFLATEKEVKLSSSYPQLQEDLKIIESKENEAWFQYLDLKESSYKHLDLLNPILNWYDKESAFYHMAKKEFDDQQNRLPLFVEKLKKEEANSLALHYINADLKPPLPEGLNIEQQKAYFKKHWFDGVDWYENSLMNSDIITNKITEYLGLYADKNQNKAMLQLAFKYAVDQIIPQTQKNPEMYAFVMDYLVRGFERYDLEEVILHIALNYPAPKEQCENEERKSEALARLEKYESMQIGQKAPDFTLPNQKGENIQLSKCQKDKILLVFWASWCPHCKNLIPQIQDWYLGKGLGNHSPEGKASLPSEIWQVYSISIDTEKQDLEAFLDSKNIQLETLCNFKGWDTQAAIDYNIYATPTMIVLDKDLTILAKPSSVNELR